MEFRSAQPSDAKLASRLLFDSFPQKAAFIIGLGSESRGKYILEKLFPIPDHRLSHTHTEMAVLKGQVIGLCTFFPGRMLPKLDRQLDRLLLRQYPLRGKIALILRGYPLIFIKEAARDEVFISNMAVKKRMQNHGVEEKILDHIGESAKELGISKLSVMVNIDSRDTRQVFEQHGFKVEAMHLESNRRVVHLGSGYLKMVKKL